MEGRTDEEKYPLGTHIQQNFLPLKQGPSMFRPGSAYVTQVKDSQVRTWLVPFEFSQSQAFQIEFGDQYCRFYTNHGPVLYTNPSATWDSHALYPPGSVVLYAGVYYLALTAAPGNPFDPPPTLPLVWYPMPQYQGSATVAIYEIPSPYAGADLTDAAGQFTLQFIQSGDVLYIGGGAAGNGYKPYTLTRLSSSPPSWKFQVYAPVDGPFQDKAPLVTNQNVALTVSATAGNGVTITAWGGNPFLPTDVGRLVFIQSQVYNNPPWVTGWDVTVGKQCVNNGNNYVCIAAGGQTGTNPPVHTSGAVYDGPNNVCWLYTDSGYGIAQITAVASGSQVTANVLLPFPSNVVGASAPITGVSNAQSALVSTNISQPETGYAGFSVFVVGVTGMTQINQNPYTFGPSTPGVSVTLSGVDSRTWGTYESGGTLVVNATTEWQLGSWSDTTEWPRAVAFFKDRLFWAGKLNLWGSVPGQYDSHTPLQYGQQTTDCGINVLISSADAANVCWLSEAIILLIGTESGEYGLDAANYSVSPLGPSNVECLRQSKWRCRPIKPLLVGPTIMYVQRAARKLLAMDYNFYLNRYDSTDQSKLSYHLSIGGFTEVAYQAEPWSVCWALRADGTLLSYTFNREDNVTAWSRHNVGGGGIVESISVIPSPDGLRDELWMIVKRTVNDTLVRTVEYIVKHYEGPQGGYAGDPQSSCWYVDCGVQLVTTPAPGAATTTITGIPPVFYNQTVAILADGGVQPSQVVPGISLHGPPPGELVIEGAFSTVTLGFAYQGNLVPMRIEGGADTGTAQGKMKSGQHLVVRLVDAFGGQVGQLSNVNPQNGVYQDPLGQTTLAVESLEAIQYNLNSTELGSPPPIQSGDFHTSFPSNAVSDQDQRDFYILVQQNLPLPMTVVGLYPSYKVEEYQ